MRASVADFFTQGQTSCFTQYPHTSLGPLTFQTHHAEDVKVANSNQMEHLEIIKV